MNSNVYHVIIIIRWPNYENKVECCDGKNKWFTNGLDFYSYSKKYNRTRNNNINIEVKFYFYWLIVCCECMACHSQSMLINSISNTSLKILCMNHDHSTSYIHDIVARFHMLPVSITKSKLSITSNDFVFLWHTNETSYFAKYSKNRDSSLMVKQQSDVQKHQNKY